MTLIDALRFLHVVGATVLIGTGAGIAFFMLISNRSRDPALIAHVAGIVVRADWLFTATAVVLQPITGTALAYLNDWPILSGWVFVSICLYLLVGAFWLPVVWIQMRLLAMARVARDMGTALPPTYAPLFRIWVACGIPAFTAVLVILWLMLTKPAL